MKLILSIGTMSRRFIDSGDDKCMKMFKTKIMDLKEIIITEKDP